MDAVSVVPPTKARTGCLCNCVGVPCPPRHERRRRRRRHPHRKNKDLESFLPPGENFARRALSASLPADPPFRLTKVLSREGAQGATLLFLKKHAQRENVGRKRKILKKQVSVRNEMHQCREAAARQNRRDANQKEKTREKYIEPKINILGKIA